MITHDPEYLTVREGADALRVSVPTVRRWIRSGQLRAYRVGKRSTRIRREDLNRLATVGDHALPGAEQDASNLIARLREHHARILARRGGKPLPSSVPIIREMREERAGEL